MSAEWALSRHDGGPALLGELRGKSGWLASKASKAERAAAVRSAGAVGGSLVRLRAAEERAGQGYVAQVEAQRARDAIEVPGLSRAAWAAVRAVEQAGTPEQRQAAARGHGEEDAAQAQARRPAVAAAWARDVLAKPGVEAELRAVMEAATRRLGEGRVGELVRGARGAHEEPGPGQREGLAGIGRAVAAMGEGQRAHSMARAEARERARAQTRVQVPTAEQERQRPRPQQERGPRLGM